jgi:hypothetical protein
LVLGGSVLVQGRSTSIVEITRVQLQQFTVSMKELAEWFDLELAQIVVDECLVTRSVSRIKLKEKSIQLHS